MIKLANQHRKQTKDKLQVVDKEYNQQNQDKDLPAIKSNLCPRVFINIRLSLWKMMFQVIILKYKIKLTQTHNHH